MSEEFCRSSSATCCLSGIGFANVEGKIGVRFASTKGFCHLSPVFAYYRWTRTLDEEPTPGGLVKFHTAHKLTLSCR
jgi:hypothetical protein